MLPDDRSFGGKGGGVENRSKGLGQMHPQLWGAWASKVSSSRSDVPCSSWIWLFRRWKCGIGIGDHGTGGRGLPRLLAASLCQPENHEEHHGDDPTGGSSHKQGWPPEGSAGSLRRPEASHPLEAVLKETCALLGRQGFYGKRQLVGSA